jgi:hypothetical protein
MAGDIAPRPPGEADTAVMMLIVAVAMVGLRGRSWVVLESKFVGKPRSKRNSRPLLALCPSPSYMQCRLVAVNVAFSAVHVAASPAFTVMSLQQTDKHIDHL